jgi:hypothetical protein
MAKLDFNVGGNITQQSPTFVLAGGNWVTRYTATSTDGITWTRASNFIGFLTGNGAFSGDLVYGNGAWILPSAADSTFVGYTSDGVNWFEATGIFPGTPSNPSYANSQFYLPHSAQAYLSYSTDGITWAYRTTGLGFYIRKIVYGNNTYTAISNATTAAATSTDSITWTSRTLGIAATDIEFGNGVFVTIPSATSTSAQTSTDGITWTTRTLPASNSWFRVAYMNSLFVAWSNSTTTAASSTDGITWTLRTMPVTPTSVVYGNGQYVASFLNTTAPTISYSTDLITWNTSSSTLTGVGARLSFGLATSKVKDTDLINLSGLTTNVQKQINNLQSSKTNAFAGNLAEASLSSINFAMFDSSGSNSGHGISTDGITWTYNTNSFPASTNITNAVYSGSLWVAMKDSNVAYASTDGLNWSTRTLAVSQSYSDIAYGNGSFVILGGTTGTVVQQSTDSVTWTTRTLPASVNWYSVAFGNNTFAAVPSATTTTAASSTDGITWTLRTLPNSVAYRQLVYANGLFIAPTNSSSTTLATSTDAITWTTKTMPAASTWQIFGGNGLLLATSMGTTTTLYSSTDAITWTLRTLPASAGSQMGYSNGLYVISYVSSYSSGNMMYSTDAITWSISANRGLPFFTGRNKFVTTNIPVFPAKRLSSGMTKFGAIVSSSYTVTDNDRYILINTSGTNTVTLPSAELHYGREIVISQRAAGAVVSLTSNVLPITSITPGTSILTGVGKFAKLVSNGFYWVIMEAN